MALRIFICSEDGLINSTLTASLKLSGFDVIGVCENEKIALDLIGRNRPDAVILHVAYGQIKAAGLAKILRAKYPDMGIVVISKVEDLRLLGISRESIPVGVITAKMAKPSDLETLGEKIEFAQSSTKSKFEFRKTPHLTDSQIETVRLMASGMTNSEIAKIRFVSEKSVEQILARISSMLGISFDHEHNSRVRILNAFYEMVNGRK